MSANVARVWLGYRAPAGWRLGVTRLQAIVSILIALGCLGLSGCGYRDAQLAFRDAYAAGDLAAAADLAARQQRWGPREHRLLWTLERGKTLLEDGQIAEARVALREAEAMMDDFDQEPETRLSAGITANIWNQLATTYRGRLSDRVLMHTYSALAALADSDFTEAQVQRRKASVAQTRAVQARHEALARTRSHERAGDVAPLLDDPSIKADIERARLAVDPAQVGTLNPWTSYLSALLMAAEGDASNARAEFARVAAMVPGNTFVQRDLADSAWLRSGSAGVVYVMMETGLGAVLDRRTVPYFTPWGGAGAVSLPVLRFERERVDEFQAGFLGRSGGADAVRSQGLMSLDSVVAADYDAEIEAVTLRAIMSLAVKESATITSRELAGDDNEWWILLLGSLWKLASAEADTRGWSSLGKRVHLVRMERTAGDSAMALRVAGLEAELALPPVRAVLVHARAVGGELAALTMPLTYEPLRDGP